MNATAIKSLRERTGEGLAQCQKAFEKCGGDFDLAIGYLKYDGCAVKIVSDDPNAYDNWVMERAVEYKQRHSNESI